ncbi:MAG: hypothetical protein ACPG45_08980 [Flavobacteriaceae bacterium]
MAMFTTIAAGVGLAATGVSTAMSFSQASSQRKAAERATREADQKMAEARARLEVNYAKSMAVQKEPYELQREAELTGTAQLIEAGQESERGSQTTAGKVLALQQQGQGAIRSAMGEELSDIQGMIIEEESRNRDVNVQLDLGEVAGKQREAAEAKARAEKAKAEGFQGAVSFVQQGVAMYPLVGKGGTHNKQLADVTPVSTQSPSTPRMDALRQQYPNLYGMTPTTPSTFSQPQLGGSQFGVQIPSNLQIQPLQYGLQNPSISGLNIGMQPNPFYYGQQPYSFGGLGLKSGKY